MPAKGDLGKRVLALDLSGRRIGLAVSDPLGIVAQGLPTLTRVHRAADLATLARLAAEYQVGRIVVGLPLLPSGEEGPEAAAVRRFARELARHTGLPVDLYDERYTTRQAERVLRAGGVKACDRKGLVDRLAAVLILQSYLDARRRGARSSWKSCWRH
ncbi:MAG: Holliday junction resolvase RuvX [Bryobacterales bacterium]|nr:Holliday junction resolvase RuvX [Bryobacteraceae bacterium]MDW8130674.1 Holliday junction resolvase RuvX [Bryobacterales bacterium]